MPRIGITGYARLSTKVRAMTLEALTAALREFAGPDLHGVTCLARGADQLFAQAMLAVRGNYEVVLPARDYREEMIGSDGRKDFDQLLGQATEVRTMPFTRSSREAFLAASNDMLDRCELLLAVWDGSPSREVGDTAHVVSVARNRKIPVKVIWPAGTNGR